MSIAKRILSRRAFNALAGAAFVAAMVPATSFAQDVTIPIIVKDTTSFYWQIVLAGARAAGKDLGVNVPELGAQSESDINGQITILENAVAGAPAAVVIAPTEFKALGKPVDEAAKSVPVIGIDSGADSKAFTSFLTTDNVQGGRIAADGLAAAIKEATGKEEGEIAIITSLPGVGSLDQRREGFLDQVKTKYPGLKVVADKYADGQATTGLNIMTDLITANPNLVGVFASNLIWRRASARRSPRTARRQDQGDRLRQRREDRGLLKEGVLAGLVVQDPYRMGYDGVKTALAVSKGEKVEANVDTGANLVTKANMSEPKIDALLNPKVN